MQSPIHLLARTALALLACAAPAQIQLHSRTFHGGANGLAVDGQGFLYVLGGGGKPIVGAANPPCAPSATNDAVWFAKLDAAGEILWSRYLNGAPFGIAVDQAGTSVYVASRTDVAPTQFPTAGYDPDPDGGLDASSRASTPPRAVRCRTRSSVCGSPATSPRRTGSRSTRPRATSTWSA